MSAAVEAKVRASRSGPWRATAGAALGLTFGPSSILLFTFGVFVPPLEHEFGWSRPSILFAVTILSLMIMIISPIQGFLIDRYGARLVTLAPILPFAAGLALLSRLGGDIRLFYLLMGIMPALGIGLWPVSFLRVVSTWFDRHLGLATGIANGGIGLGAAILPLFASALIAADNWRLAYLGLAGVVLVVVGPVTYWLLHESGAEEPARSSPLLRLSGSGLSFSRICRSISFVALAVGFFLLGFINTGLIASQVSLLVDRGMTPLQAASVQSAFGLSVLVGRFAIGALLDRIPAYLLMAATCVLGIIACLFYAAGATGVTAYACAVMLGTIFGAEFDVLSFIIKKAFGIRAFGRTYGVVFAIFQFGAAIGVTVLPYTRSLTGSYALGLLIYAGALLIAVASFFVLGRRLPTEGLAA